MSEWKKTWCNLCAVTCGLEMEVEDNRIINVRPDPTSPRSNGYCCRKGRSAKYFVENRDRLTYPKKRVGDHYERISWEQAYREIAEKARAIIDKHGPRSTAFIGGGTYSMSTPAATMQPLQAAIGTQYFFNPVGVEFMGDWWSHGKIIGDQAHYVEPDDDNNEVVIFWGSNAYVSHQIPNSKRVIRGFSQDPDKMLIVVDPRLSETARMSDMHIMPAFGSDSLFMRALIALIVEKGWENKEYLAKYTADWDHAKRWFTDFDIDAALKVCQVSREQATEFARILTTKKWGCHQDLGLFFGRHSTTNSYLFLLLTIVCGMFLLKGGNVLPLRVITLPNTDENDPKVWRLPVTGRFPVYSVYPEGAVPDEVLGDNEDRIRFMICTLSNPCRSYPDSQRMEEALKHLELFVAIDCVETETTMVADYVLPSCNGYENDGDFDIFTLNYPDCVWGSRKRIVEPVGEAKEDCLIMAELTQAMGYIPEIPESLYKAAEQAAKDGDRIKYFLKVVMWIAKGRMKYFDQAATVICLTLGKYIGYGRSMNWAGLLTCNLPKFGVMAVEPDRKQHPILSRMPVFKDFCTLDAAFKLTDEHPEGAVIAHADEDHLMERHILHKDKKFHLWCEEVDAYLRKYITPEAEEEALTLKDGNNMILSAGRHADAGVNNAMRNPGTYQYRRPYVLSINPDDAREMGFEDGQTVKLSTNRGSIEIPLEVTWQTARGYVIMPHYFGLHYQGKMIGMHANYLTDNHDIDELTGNSRWRYTPCRVEALD